MGMRGFLRNERGSSFESFALAMSVTAVLFVAAADVLHYASKRNGMLARIYDRIEAARIGEDGLRGEVDYTPTGSIVGLRHPPSLDPCTDAQR
jgi:hypothetical protein